MYCKAQTHKKVLEKKCKIPLIALCECCRVTARQNWKNSQTALCRNSCTLSPYCGWLLLQWARNDSQVTWVLRGNCVPVMTGNEMIKLSFLRMRSHIYSTRDTSFILWILESVVAVPTERDAMQEHVVRVLGDSVFAVRTHFVRRRREAPDCTEWSPGRGLVQKSRVGVVSGREQKTSSHRPCVCRYCCVAAGKSNVLLHSWVTFPVCHYHIVGDFPHCCHMWGMWWQYLTKT